MNDQMNPHPPFPISCGDETCCTGTAGESVTARCLARDCAGTPEHPANFHRYDDAVISTSEMRAIEKRFERFFEEMHEAMVDEGDIPFPTEYEGEALADGYFDEYRDWFTMQVIRKLIAG